MVAKTRPRRGWCAIKCIWTAVPRSTPVPLLHSPSPSRRGPGSSQGERGRRVRAVTGGGKNGQNAGTVLTLPDPRFKQVEGRGKCEFRKTVHRQAAHASICSLTNSPSPALASAAGVPTSLPTEHGPVWGQEQATRELATTPVCKGGQERTSMSLGVCCIHLTPPPATRSPGLASRYAPTAAQRTIFGKTVPPAASPPQVSAKRGVAHVWPSPSRHHPAFPLARLVSLTALLVGGGVGATSVLHSVKVGRTEHAPLTRKM